jgi:hypothetical protein
MQIWWETYGELTLERQTSSIKPGWLTTLDGGFRMWHLCLSKTLQTQPDSHGWGCCQCSHVCWALSGEEWLLPHLNQDNDRKATTTIRRRILDAFWSQASLTVWTHANVIQRGCKLSASLRLDSPYLELGPLSSFDDCGYRVAHFYPDAHKIVNFH